MRIYKWLRQNFTMLLRFGSIGLLTAALYAFLLILAVEVASFSPAVGVAIAYVLAVLFNYCAHYYWTYGSERGHRATGVRYLAVITIIFAINVTATAFLPNWLGVSYWFAQLLLGVMMAAMTFISLSYWVFSASRNVQVSDGG